jgi:multiple sugar transport system substrate-binding protein
VKGFKTARTALLAGGVALAMVAAAACSNGGGSPIGGGALPTDNVTLTFWWWGDDARAATTQKIIDKFQAKYPFIHVDGESQTFDHYFDNLATQFAGNSAPDVITMGGSYVLSYAEGGNLLQLDDPALGNEMHINAFTPSILSASTVDNKVYGVPTGGNTIAVMVNPKVFAAAGVALPNDDTWTWQDFVSIANQITAQSPAGTYGAEVRTYDLLGAFAGQRTPLYDSAGNLTATADTLTAQFQLLKDLEDGHGLPPADLMAQVLTVPTAQTLFGQGRAGMFVGYTNQIGDYATAAGNPADGTDDFQLLRLPSESQYAHPGQALLPSQYFTVNKATKYPRQSALLVDFLVNSNEAGELVLTNRGVPSNPQVAADIAPLLQGYDKTQAQFMSRVAPKLGPYVPPPAWATDVNSITQNLETAVESGTTTPADAAQQWLTQMAQSKTANS